MVIEVLDPTWGDRPAPFESAPRLESLHGANVLVISNGKQGTETFFEALAHELRSRHGADRVEIAVKGNYSAPAEPELIDRLAQWHAMVAGVGD